MRHHRNRSGGAAPPETDPAFAEALTGSYFKNECSARNRNRDHKSQMLCRQVQRALNLALGELRDDVLRELYVADVTCAPNASHLLVHVVLPAAASAIDVLTRLEPVAPRLRSEVARSITRKRAPELTFLPVAPPEVQP
jgi:ribosome-binding factor A